MLVRRPAPPGIRPFLDTSLVSPSCVPNSFSHRSRGAGIRGLTGKQGIQSNSYKEEWLINYVFVRPWFVRSWWSSFVVYRARLTSSTPVQHKNLSFVCSREEKKKRAMGIRKDTHHGHYTGRTLAGTSRPRTKALRICSPTALQQSIAPKSCIARATVLVIL